MADLSSEDDDEAVDRANLLRVFRDFLDANQLDADWDSVERAGNRMLVNSLSMMSPFGPAEKQALLEAPDLRSRAETLIAITEIVLAQGGSEGGNVLQ
jgi:Lon protease-like protein